MLKDHPYLYPYSKDDAKRSNELDRWQDSFRNNVACSRAIEEAIRQDFDRDTDSIREGCAGKVLEQYGFKRVNFVLAHTLKQRDIGMYVDADSLFWAASTSVPRDPEYGRYYAVDTAAPLLNTFIHQVRDAYHLLDLFGWQHCMADSREQDYAGKVLVLSTDTLREGCWSQRNQLWLAHDGFGCGPNARGRSIRATCLGDGEMTRWNRADFTGVLDEQYLPDWAREKLEELRGPTQEQNSGPTMGGMA